MQKILLSCLIIVLTAFIGLTLADQAWARSGCCSYHKGVRADGCGCNDGTPLSDKCAPYYFCSTETAPTVPTDIPFPTAIIYTPRPIVPTNTPQPTRALPTPTPYHETAMDKKKLFKVISVIEGDAMVVNIRGHQETVQLLGIDAPSSTQCFGNTATNKLKSMVEGNFVKLVRDPTWDNRDMFGNLIRYVYLKDKKHTFVNAQLINQGYAFSTDDVLMSTKFNNLEQSAKAHNAGWWGECK